MNQEAQIQHTEEPIIDQTVNEEELKTNDHIANHLARLASNVPDVKGATAVVAGPYAVVGIDVDAKLNRERVGTVKFSVNEALRDDPYGKTAVVIADADITKRLQNMKDRMDSGETVKAVVDELAEIVGRYMPVFPLEEESEKELEKKPEET